MSQDSYGPVLGAEARESSVHFALWTSKARACAVRIFHPGEAPRTLALSATEDGFFELDVASVAHGARYAFVLDGQEVRDPYAKFLPDGVDAPAAVWRSSYAWKHPAPSRPLSQSVHYELHVGTFTEEGTYAAAATRLAQLAELGITTIELMPLAAFPGTRGWGYDGVAHYAPFAPYGNPDELRAFIDAAHGLGLAVLLDVVYNHFGPSGNVLALYGDEYFTAAHPTPWGDAPNFEHAAMRRYVVRNVRYWLEELRFDGLRFDAVHAIVDDSPRHVLREIADMVATLVPKRFLIAEDERNDPQIVHERRFDATWADDFHHQIRVAMTGEHDGYYAAYTGKAADVAKTIEKGWFYRGEVYPVWGKPRGKDAPNLPADAFVYCIQNHDQIGNRAFGDRLTESVAPDAYAAMTILLLFLPMTPLLFMGQEWAASTPFLYFTDHDEDLGHMVTQGRRKEFARFAAFADETTRSRIPDPQSVQTFEKSRLDWAERNAPERAPWLALHRDMLSLRSGDPVFRAARREDLRAFAEGDCLVVERWLGRDVRRLIVNLGSASAPLHLEGAVGEPRVLLGTGRGGAWGEPLPPRGAVLVAYEGARS
jgi:maltooligosyltrehalose trehalohydrolase